MDVGAHTPTVDNRHRTATSFSSASKPVQPRQQFSQSTMGDYSAPANKHSTIVAGNHYSLPGIKEQARNKAQTQMAMYSTMQASPDAKHQENGWTTTRQSEGGMETDRSPREPISMSPKTAVFKRRGASVPKGRNYAYSVKEQVKFSSRKMSQASNNGIDYDLKRWHHDVNKPIIHRIHKDRV
jgi:hypothetical protein